MLETGRGSSHLLGPVLLPQWSPCVALGVAISPTLDPSVLSIVYIEGMTLKKFRVIFHALNSGLICFERLLFYLFTFLPFQGWTFYWGNDCHSVFKYCVFPDVIYCLRCVLNQYISLSHGKIPGFSLIKKCYLVYLIKKYYHNQ